MGALPQVRPESALRKPPVSEKLDKYGRDPNSLPEQLRTRGEAWAPRPIAVEADLHRLSSGSVYYAFISIVNTLSLGRPRAAKEPWYEWTEPYSAQEFAEYMYANVRDVQRKISELESRGMIAVKVVKAGGVPKYSVSLLYSKWRGLEDYAVWKRRQVVTIDESSDEAADDETPAAIAKDAVVVSKPKRIAPGRASRAAKVEGGVSEFVFQNDSACDAVCSAVLQSGRLVAIFKASAQAAGELKAKQQCSPEVASENGEDNGNTARHTCRGVPANEGSAIPTSATPSLTVDHPRAAELIKLFDPLLAAGHVALLSSDLSSLSSACSAIQDCDHNYLVKFAVQRAARKFGSPRSVVPVCLEALNAWNASKVLDGAGLKTPTREEIDAMCKRDAEALKKAQAEINRRYKK